MYGGFALSLHPFLLTSGYKDFGEGKNLITQDILDLKLNERLRGRLRGRLRARLHARLHARLCARLHARLHAIKDML